MEKAIKKYLRKRGYGIDCVSVLKGDKLLQVYELYTEGKEPQNVVIGVHGFFAVYYHEKKQYDKMVEYNKLQIVNSSDDYAAIKNLAKYLDFANDDKLNDDIFKYFNNKNMPTVVTRLKKYIKVYNDQIDTPVIMPTNQTNQIINSGNVTIDTLNEMRQLMDKFKLSDDLSEIYNLYDKCNDNNIKKLYLCNIVTLKNFTPSAKMISDILTLEFNIDAPLEIKLIKSIFHGCNVVNYSSQNVDLNDMQIAINNNNFDEIHKLYEQCPNENIKKIYLTKIMILKDFKPSDNMVKDIINLEFNSDVSLEIKLLKSVFSGYKII